MLQQETSHHHSDSVALDELFAQLGSNITFRGLILKLSGVDILDSVRPQLIRICASAMDEGIAPWQLPDRKQLGPYNAWRTTVIYDANPFYMTCQTGNKLCQSYLRMLLMPSSYN